MTNKAEAERIAQAINAYRPSWPVQSLVTFIGRHHQHRPPRDVLIALAWVAADPETEKPGRINENGPWWKAAEADIGDQPRHRRNTGPIQLGARDGITDPAAITAKAAEARAAIRKPHQEGHDE